MKLRNLFWICKLGILIFFILLIVGLKLEASWLIVAGVILLVIITIVFYLKYRCPNCGKVLDSRKLTPAKRCPKCGKQLF